MDSSDGRFHFYWSGPFSQWHPSAFVLDACHFVTAEQAMMYFKAELFDDHDIATKILAATDPGKQKALGRQVKGFEEMIWDDAKCNIIYRINVAKFSQNKGLRRKLFQTGNLELVEASPVDVIWGIGLEASVADQTAPAEWPGQNLLGQALTRVREELKRQFPEEAASVAQNGALNGGTSVAQ